MKIIISVILLTVVLTAGLIYLYHDDFFVERIGIDNGSIPTKIKDDVQTKRTKIIAIGDSLTAGYGLNLDESYPKQLEKKLLDNNFQVEIINSGVSGETTAGLLDRIEFIKKQKPEVVLITIGGNDALRALPIEETKKNMLKIIQSLREVVDSRKIFLMEIQAPGNLGIFYGSKFNGIYKEISNQERINLVPFVVAEVFTQSDFMQNDGIHPNQKGYKYLVDNFIYKSVAKVLK